MDIFLYTAQEHDAWHAALAASLPQARIHSWREAPICDYAVLWRPPASLLAGQTQLKAIFSLGAGVDGLLATKGLPRDVPLIRMEDAGMARQMIEYALYAALHQYRAFDHYAQDQQRQHWVPQELRFREDFCIGVLGLGVLGGQVAQALAAFGFRVNGWSRNPKQIDEINCYSGAAGLATVLQQSELLIVLLPLTADTRALLNRDRLMQLPRGAGVANVARGELVVEADLLELLDSGHIGHAFLDVFAAEPLVATSRLWRHANVSMTPHVAALSPYHEAAQQVAEKIQALERGAAISGVVEFSRGY